jgi:4-hydroxy-tetrahydrodipicolinate reductase
MNALRLAIAGCCGRTGQTVLRLAADDPAFRLTAAVTTSDDPRLGEDAGIVAGRGVLGVPVTDRCAAPCDVVVDFTLPSGCIAWARWCAENNVPLVSGTTGLSAAETEVLHGAAERVPVVWSANMSIGVNLLLELVAQAAARLDKSWDVEICETHHNQKVDAPSGTALAFCDAVRQARGSKPQATVYGRHGVCGPRDRGEIGIHALRLGDEVGEHAVHFAGAGETLTFRHRARSREIFATGALHAARWIVNRPPGLYHMRDVLANR